MNSFQRRGGDPIPSTLVRALEPPQGAGIAGCGAWTIGRASKQLLTITFFLLILSQSWAEELDCLLCHEKVTSAENVHPAALMGCALCHQDPHGKDKAELSLTAEVPDLCFQCHDAKGFKQEFQHTAVAAGLCTSCHNPHASNATKLLVSIAPALCFQCHDAASFSKRSVHVPVASGACLSCHASHSSSTAAVLKSPIEELCAACHQKESRGTHVLAGLGSGNDHPISTARDPSRPGSAVSCVSCHKPHASDSHLLFATDSLRPKSLCLSCHAKVRIPPQP
jgi:predicted CXXCH cytochrome family protein